MAIAFDAQSTSTGGASPRTHSHTCTGSDRILFIATSVNTASAATITVTYNGVSATQIGSQKFIGGGGSIFLHFLVAPATGANNIVVTRTSGAGNVFVLATSYTGADQGAQPNVSGTAGPTTTTSYSQSLTTTISGCWSVMAGTASSALSVTAGANTVKRLDDGGYGGMFICDSGGPKTPSGVATLTVTAASQPYVSHMASFFPVGGVPDIGTKTINGLAYASVKTINGLATASVKTINGLA